MLDNNCVFKGIQYLKKQRSKCADNKSYCQEVLKLVLNLIRHPKGVAGKKRDGNCQLLPPPHASTGP